MHAAAALKNRVQTALNGFSDDTDKENRPQNVNPLAVPLSVNDQEYLKQNIFAVMDQAAFNEPVRQIIEQVIVTLGDTQPITQWSSALAQVDQRLQSSDPIQIFSGLASLHSIVSLNLIYIKCETLKSSDPYKVDE